MINIEHCLKPIMKISVMSFNVEGFHLFVTNFEYVYTSEFLPFLIFFLSVLFYSFLFRFLANIAVSNAGSAIDIVTVGFHEVIHRSTTYLYPCLILTPLNCPFLQCWSAAVGVFSACAAP